MYIGIIPLILAFIAIGNLKKNQSCIIHVTILILSLPLAFGAYTPLFPVILRIIPPISFLGRPYRFLLWATISLSTLAGFGLDHITKSRDTKQKLKPLIIFIVLFTILDLNLFGFRHLNLFKYMKDDQRYANYKPPIVDFLENNGNKQRIYTSRAKNEPGVNLLAINNNLRFNISNTTATVSLSPKWYASNFLSIDPARDLKILGLLNVKYVLADHEIFSSNLKKIYDREIKIYLNKKTSSRVFIVNDFKIIRDRAEGLDELNNPEFDFAKYVILEEKPQVSIYPETKNIKSEAHIIKDDGSELSINAKMASPGFLVLTDTFYPGWKVFVDNVEKKIYRANVAFRAVFLKEGIHEVKFLYDPVSFKLGVLITGITLLLLSMFFIIESLKTKN
jgi:hypothetical protein